MTHHSEFSDDSLNLPVAKPDLDLVVFDWDGTIVDSTGAIADSIRAAARDLGLDEPNAQQASHVIGLGLQDALRLAVPTLPPQRLGEFVERYRVHYFGRDPLSNGRVNANWQSEHPREEKGTDTDDHRQGKSVSDHLGNGPAPLH